MMDRGVEVRMSKINYPHMTTTILLTLIITLTSLPKNALGGLSIEFCTRDNFHGICKKVPVDWGYCLRIPDPYSNNTQISVRSGYSRSARGHSCMLYSNDKCWGENSLFVDREGWRSVNRRYGSFRCSGVRWLPPITTILLLLILSPINNKLHLNLDPTSYT